MCSALINASVPVLLFVFGLLNVGNSVKINRLQVPEVIRHGAPVVLDCDFTLDGPETGLVIKWFFDKDKNLVYQWIPGINSRPQDSGILKGRLNLDYAASVDGKTAYRALHILKPGPDLSGEYTCSVSTFQSEDIQSKSMLVFVPEKTLILRRVSADPEDIRVECRAEGVFPKPDIVLRSQQREIPENEISVQKRGPLFDVTATATMAALEGPEEFGCEIHIPQANYTKRQETVFFPGSKGCSLSCVWWMNLAIVTLGLKISSTFLRNSC